FDRSTVVDDVVPDTGAVLTQGQLIGLLQEHARPGDTIVAAAGGPPGDLQKVWDATDGRHCHLEFGFSCMGDQITAGLGRRLAGPASTCASASPGSPRASAPVRSPRPRPTRCAPPWPIPATTTARSSSWYRSSRTPTCPAPACGGTSPRPRCPTRRRWTGCA